MLVIRTIPFFSVVSANYGVCLLGVFLGLVASSLFSQETRYSFPEDASVIDARRDFGAVGDGEADDTLALQMAIDASCGLDGKGSGKSKVLFIPNGIYRVTDTLVISTALGPWVYGETRDGVVIRMDSGMQNVKSVLRTHPSDEGATSADWFMRNLRNFTIDASNNPHMDGIRYYATNSGCLQNVRVVGQGNIGVNSGFLGLNGPNLIQDVEIEGFDTGILSQWNWGQTLSRVTIRNARKVGLQVEANVVAAEDLIIENSPLAVDVRMPNDWGHWAGVLSLVNGNLHAGNPQGPAINNAGILYARNITTSGFLAALSSATQSASETNPMQVSEFHSHPVKKLFKQALDSSLQLPIEKEPRTEWEHDHSKWLCADDYGAIAGDNLDDSDAIEKAFDAAAKEGKTVVYFRGCGGQDPNHFTLSRPVAVPMPVRLVLGVGWARILGENNGGFMIDDQSAPLVKFQNIDAFGGRPIELVNTSQSNVMVVESCGVRVVGRGKGSIFMTDCPSSLELAKPGQSCWARQLNPEGDSDVGLVQNRGGKLWCLGVKHEGRGVRFATYEGGATELLGVFNYGGTKDEMDPRPSFLIENSDFSVAGLREIAFDQHTVLNKVRESHGRETKLLTKKDEGQGGWIGWALYRGHSPNGPLK